MKKLLAFTMSLILTAGAFTGCGSSDTKDSNSSSSSSKDSSQSELNDAAILLNKAFSSALSDLEMDGADIFGKGYIASDGDHTYLSDSDYSTVIKEASNYYTDIDKCDYVVFVNDGVVDSLYVADSMDSKIVGTFPKWLDFSGTLESAKTVVIEKEITTTIAAEEKPTTEDTTTSNSNIDKSKLRYVDTYNDGITVSTFVNNFDIIIPAIFGDEIKKVGLTPDDLKLTSVKTKLGTDLNVFGYNFCANMFYVNIGADPVTEKIESVTIAFDLSDHDLPEDIAKTIAGDLNLTVDLISSSFAVVNYYEDRETLVDSVNLILEKGKASNFGNTTTYNYEEGGISYNLHGFGGNISGLGSGISFT